MQWSGTPLEGEAVVFVPPLCLPLEVFSWHAMSPAGSLWHAMSPAGSLWHAMSPAGRTMLSLRIQNA